MNIRTIKSGLVSLCKKGAFSIVAGNFATKFVSFFGSIFLVRVLTKNEFGILTYAENIMGYFVLASGAGLSMGISRYLLLQESVPEKYACYRYAIKRGNTVNMMLIVIGIAFCILYPHPEQYMAYRWVPMLLMVVLPFLFVQNCGLNTIRCMFDNHLFAICSFSFSALIIILRVTGGAIGGLYGTVTGRLVANIVAAGISLCIVKKRFFKDAQIIDYNAEDKRGMNTYSLEIMLTNGLWQLFVLNDVFLLGRFSNELVLADYKIASVIPGNLAILVAAIGTFTSPYFTLHGKQKDNKWIWEKYKLTLLLSAAIMGVAVLVCLIFSKPIIKLLYGDSYLSAVPVMRILLIAAFFNCGLRSVTANALSSLGEQKYNMYLAGICVVVQMVLNVLFIPYFGSIATAYINVGIYVFMAGILTLVFFKKYKI